MNENKNITIGDVAKALGVSKTTVSRAISGKGIIGDATRQRVLDYIEVNNYRPNPMAKGLADQRKYNICWAIPGDSNVYALPFFQKGCELNAKESCTFSGNIFAYGAVVDKDMEKALNYYEKGCELKDGIACNLLGSFYENGENVDKDQKKAFYYYTRACNEGDWAQACETLKEISEK